MGMNTSSASPVTIIVDEARLFWLVPPAIFFTAYGTGLAARFSSVNRIPLKKEICKTITSPSSTGTTSGLLMSAWEYRLNTSWPRNTIRFPAMWRMRYRKSKRPVMPTMSFVVMSEERKRLRDAIKNSFYLQRLTRTNGGRYDSVFCTYENSRVSSQSDPRAVRREGAFRRSGLQGV